MPYNSSGHQRDRVKDAPAGALERPALGKPRHRRARGRWGLLAAAICTAVLSAVIATYLLPGASGGWDPLAAAQWLGAAGLESPTATPVASSTLVVGMTPFPSATTTSAALGQSRRGTQGCNQRGKAPASYLTLLASTEAAPGTRGEVALTFDDGPNPIYTPQILATLHAWNAPATFFVTGIHAQRYPAIVQAEAAAGNAIGNHTLTHPSLPGLSPAQIANEINSASAIFRAVTGNDCLWLFRPPYGAYNASVVTQARQRGFTTIVWDVDGLDWTRPGAAAIANRVISQLHSGAIILLHDGAPDNEIQYRGQTVAALPLILAAMQRRGLRPVTLPTLLSDAGYIKLPR